MEYILFVDYFLERKENKTEELLRINLRTLPLSQCNETYLEFYKKTNQIAIRDGISKSQYCAYDPDSTKESCRLTSGAPLQIYPLNSLLPNVVGIISFGVGSVCSDKHPEVLTRIAHYIPWIEANVWPFDRSMKNIIDKFFLDIFKQSILESISFLFVVHYSSKGSKFFLNKLKNEKIIGFIV